MQPGESHLVRSPPILRTVLGSCVGVTFLVPAAGVGALCHPMLPSCPRAGAGIERRAQRLPLRRLHHPDIGAAVRFAWARARRSPGKGIRRSRCAARHRSAMPADRRKHELRGGAGGCWPRKVSPWLRPPRRNARPQDSFPHRHRGSAGALARFRHADGISACAETAHRAESPPIEV